MKYLVEMRGISKKFDGVLVLKDVNFSLLAGEVHIVLGENEAGKSTLMKILSGIYEPSQGEIIINGKKHLKLTPRLAEKEGIALVHQELNIVEELSIMENIFLGNLLSIKVGMLSIVNYKEMKKKTVALLENIGLSLDPSTLVKDLSISQRQLIEIAKALALNPKVIIMDKPTSSLTQNEIDKLFEIIRQLKKEGKGIIYITHKLAEVKEIGDRVTVLKDGEVVGTKNVSETNVDELVVMMVGRKIEENYTNPEAITNEIIFNVRNLTRVDRKVKNVSFDLYKGEILGFAGLVGSGRTELMEAIFKISDISSGEVYLNGKLLKYKDPYGALKMGIGLVPEDRRGTGFFSNFEIWKNISIEPLLKKSKLHGMWGLLNKKEEIETANRQKNELRIKCSSIYQNVSELSGGNQQKVVIGKWLAAGSKVLILDEPTKGVDVGARSEIYRIIRKLANEGVGIIVVSSDLKEILTICDRITVFKDGEIKKVFHREEATEEKIASVMLK
jgi:D-allose transport system ATP-binding protein